MNQPCRGASGPVTLVRRTRELDSADRPGPTTGWHRLRQVEYGRLVRLAKKRSKQTEETYKKKSIGMLKTARRKDGRDAA